jgi:hypothetical protein
MSDQPELKLLEAQVEDGLGELIAATRLKLTTLQRERDSILREIATYEAKLRVWDATRHSLSGSSGSLHAVTEGRLPTKPEAVLALLGEQPRARFRLAEIRDALIERGWMENTRQARHALEVAALNLAKRGAIQRIQKGVYWLGTPNGAPRQGLAPASALERQHAVFATPAVE